MVALCGKNCKKTAFEFEEVNLFFVMIETSSSGGWYCIFLKFSYVPCTGIFTTVVVPIIVDQVHLQYLPGTVHSSCQYVKETSTYIY